MSAFTIDPIKRRWPSFFMTNCWWAHKLIESKVHCELSITNESYASFSALNLLYLCFRIKQIHQRFCVYSAQYMIYFLSSIVFFSTNLNIIHILIVRLFLYWFCQTFSDSETSFLYYCVIQFLWNLINCHFIWFELFKLWSHFY